MHIVRECSLFEQSLSKQARESDALLLEQHIFLSKSFSLSPYIISIAPEKIHTME